VAPRPYPFDAWDERERRFGHAQPCRCGEVVTDPVQPSDETSSELLERLTVPACRGCKRAGQLSPHRVLIIGARWELNLRQQVGAEQFDEVAGQLLHGWRSVLLERQHLGPPGFGPITCMDRSVPAALAMADGETPHGRSATVSTSANAIGRRRRHDGRCRRSLNQGGTVSSTTIEAPRTDPTGAGQTPALSDTVTHVMTDRPRPGALTLDQRVAIRHQLVELAELEEDRVERVATMGAETLAAYDVGIRDAVRDALAKLASGTYGNCETCRRPIPAARLEAVPYARRCVSCQERMEDGWDQVRGLVGHVVRTLAGEPQGPSEMVRT
jgi:RNA polymerase-binding transcription factor DksA